MPSVDEVQALISEHSFGLRPSSRVLKSDTCGDNILVTFCLSLLEPVDLTVEASVDGFKASSFKFPEMRENDQGALKKAARDVQTTKPDASYRKATERG